MCDESTFFGKVKLAFTRLAILLRFGVRDIRRPSRNQSSSSAFQVALIKSDKSTSLFSLFLGLAYATIY